LYLAKGKPLSSLCALCRRCCLSLRRFRFLAGVGVFENSYWDRVHEASWLAESNACWLPLANRIENRFSVMGFSNMFLSEKVLVVSTSGVEPDLQPSQGRVRIQHTPQTVLLHLKII
jgi:hypothetical protein